MSGKRRRDRRAYLKLGDTRLFQFWLSTDLKALLDITAESKSLSTSAYVRQCIWRALQRDARRESLEEYKRSAWGKTG